MNDQNKKYELTGETMEHKDHTLHRIRALRDFGYKVKKDCLGGWIEKEENLSQYDDCWIYDNAIVWGEAKVCGNAMVRDNTEIYGYTEVLVGRDIKIGAHELMITKGEQQ